MTARSGRREATAFHEAGHAVVATDLRSGWRSVSVSKNETTLGRVTSARLGKRFQPDVEVDSRTRRVVERDVMVFLAGREAEAIHTGRRNNVGAQHDLHCAHELASYAVRLRGGRGGVRRVAPLSHR
jgi:ATP-dependent Zn protease